MKKSILFLFLVVSSINAIAQDDEDEKIFKFGLGTSISLPLSDLKTITTYGIGFELLGVYNLSENLAGFFQGGVDVFASKYGTDASVLHIPIMAGARYKSSGFFIGAGIGYSNYNTSESSLGGFLYSPQIGYDMGKYQVLLNYTSTMVTGGSFSYIGLKAFHTF